MNGYDQLEQYRIAAVKRGDKTEAERLARLMEKLDQYRAAYGREQRRID